MFLLIYWIIVLTRYAMVSAPPTNVNGKVWNPTHSFVSVMWQLEVELHIEDLFEENACKTLLTQEIEWTCSFARWNVDLFFIFHLWNVV